MEMSSDLAGPSESNAPLDDLDDGVHNSPFRTSWNDSFGDGNSEDIQNEAVLYNLDDNDSFVCPNPPQATLESLANVQKIIEQIQGASFSEEQNQWSCDEFDTFLHPPNEQFCVDDRAKVRCPSTVRRLSSLYLVSHMILSYQGSANRICILCTPTRHVLLPVPPS